MVLVLGLKRTSLPAAGGALDFFGVPWADVGSDFALDDEKYLAAVVSTPLISTGGLFKLVKVDMFPQGLTHAAFFRGEVLVGFGALKLLVRPEHNQGSDLLLYVIIAVLNHLPSF